MDLIQVRQSKTLWEVCHFSPPISLLYEKDNDDDDDDDDDNKKGFENKGEYFFLVCIIS